MSNKPNLLRTAAEARLVRAPSSKAQEQSAETLLHELQVHQVELEMQNDQLRASQLALEESRDRYAALYEFAPVGYLTLSRAGQITAINLTGCTLLGRERGKLLQHRFDFFVSPPDRDRWHIFFSCSLKQTGQLVFRSIKTNTYQVTPRSNLFQRNTTGDALISAMPLRMRCFRSSLDATRMCRRNVRAILEKAHSIKLSQEPCLGV